MDIKTISVTKERKFNLGNYESLEIGCSLWGQIDPEEDAGKFKIQNSKFKMEED
jgi:hypothetical protein